MSPITWWIAVKAFAKRVDVACQRDTRIAPGRLPTTKGEAVTEQFSGPALTRQEDSLAAVEELNRGGRGAVKTMTENDHSSSDDQTLVRAAQRGDMALFEGVVARHRDNSTPTRSA